MSRHALGHQVSQGLFPVRNMGNTILLQGRSSAGLEKRVMGQLVSHPKEAEVCLGVEAKHHQFQQTTIN